MIRVKVAIAGAACLLLAGCQTIKHQPLNDAAAAELRGKSVVVAQYPPTPVAVMTAGKIGVGSLFGVVGGAIAAAEAMADGKRLMEENGIDDPALEMADMLATILSEQRGLVRMPTPSILKGETGKSDRPDLIAAHYTGADYVVDVRTINTMIIYYPMDWTHYRLVYAARFRLIDTATKKPVAQTMCTTTQGDDKNPPTMDELLADSAALLRTYLAKAKTMCADLLAKELLKLGPAPSAPQPGVQPLAAPLPVAAAG